MKGKLWLRLIKQQKIKQDLVIPTEQDNWQEALIQGCHQLDISAPVILLRHLRDWVEYSQTRFLSDDFIDHFPFDKLEVEYFEEGKRPAPSDDYRNA